MLERELTRRTSFYFVWMKKQGLSFKSLGLIRRRSEICWVWGKRDVFQLSMLASAEIPRVAVLDRNSSTGENARTANQASRRFNHVVHRIAHWGADRRTAHRISHSNIHPIASIAISPLLVSPLTVQYSTALLISERRSHRKVLLPWMPHSTTWRQSKSNR
jgi:hypothetical protein